MQNDVDTDIYAEKALSQISRLLSNMDRNHFSKTYGCLNREYWLTRVRDFPDSIAQFGTLSLALVYSHPFPSGEKYHKNKEILDWTIAGIKYWMHIQHSDGSFDEFYPNERGWAGPTGFLLYAMLRSLEVLGDDFPKDLEESFFECVRKSAWFLATREERGVLANHHAMALLPVYQAYHHLKHRSPNFAQALYIKFEERLNVFLSYTYKEGWSLEYDGVDPGYLSATVSFLSKMMRYAHDESWAPQIQEVIDKSIEFTRFFFYPNGSYAGTIGSRQTLHFYPHGYERESRKNQTALACANQGIQGLANGMLVPPEIQGERYYLYRIPEYLEAYIDKNTNRETSAVVAFDDSPFENYFSEAKIFIKNTSDHYVVANVARGNVVKVFNKKDNRLCFASDGIVTTTGKRSSTTQWIGPEYNCSYEKGVTFVSGLFHVIPQKNFTPLTMIMFRVFMLLTAWNARIADLVKGTIRAVLMTQTSKTKMAFTRRLIVNVDSLTIETKMENIHGVTELRIGGQFAARYVPQSRYFQNEELINTYETISGSQLKEITRRGNVTVREMLDLKTGNIQFELDD